MDNRSGDSAGGFKVQVRANATKFTNMERRVSNRHTHKKESRYLVREGKVFIKDKAKVASRVSGSQ